MKKILWFSRHDMTDAQAKMFEKCQITKINGSPVNVHLPFEGYLNNAPEATQMPALKELVQDYDVLCVVLPTNLKEQLLGVTSKPILEAKPIRLTNEKNETVFGFGGWQRILKIEFVTEPISEMFELDLPNAPEKNIL